LLLHELEHVWLRSDLRRILIWFLCSIRLVRPSRQRLLYLVFLVKILLLLLLWRLLRTLLRLLCLEQEGRNFPLLHWRS